MGTNGNGDAQDILADLIFSKKRVIIDLWREEVTDFYGERMERRILENKISELLELLADRLRGQSRFTEIDKIRRRKDTETHGFERAVLGFDVVQLAREFHVLRRVILTVCEGEGTPLSREARDTLDEIIDEAAATAVARYSEKREELIQEGDARQMAFLVHDLRAPLGAISLAAVELADAIPLESRSPEVVETLTLLQQNVQKLAVSMEDAMHEFAEAFSLRGHLHVRRVRVQEVVAELFERVLTQARANETILSNKVPAETKVEADPDALHRVLLNLITNALRYTRRGEISISSLDRKEDVEICVRDTGAGIAAKEIDALFESGKKDPGSPGMGFGLAIVRHLVELHGGTVRLESMVNEGTMVTITLPKEGLS